MKSSLLRKIALFTMAAVLTTGVLSGCATKKSTTNTPDATAKSEPPTPISIMSVFYSVGPITDDNVIIKEFEKRTNTDLTITWITGNNYEDKVSVTLASGDIPDMTLLLTPGSSQARTMATQGAFWEIGKYYKDYPNMSKFPADIWENSKKQDGKIYGLPRPRAIDGQAPGKVSLRKDWLDNLKLKVPETMDELYEVAKAFTNNDPDGNGQKDTVGIAAFVNADGLGNLGEVVNIFNAANNDWKLDKDGNVQHMWTDSSTKQALAWLRKAYSEGLIHKDVGIMKQTQQDEAIMAGKVGINFDPPQKTTVYDATLKKTNPKAETFPLVALSGPNGKFSGRGSGVFGEFIIPKKVPEEKMKKIMKLYDFGVGEEGHELAKYGLPNVHFTKSGDTYTTIADTSKADAITCMGNIFAKFDKYGYATMGGTTPEEAARNRKIIDEKAKISIPNPTTGIYSETEQKVGPDFRKKNTEAFMKVMLGTESMEYWDAYVTKLKADGDYQKWIKEIQESYKVKAGKK